MAPGVRDGFLIGSIGSMVSVTFFDTYFLKLSRDGVPHDRRLPVQLAVSQRNK
jgi:hypothetical protein